LFRLGKEKGVTPEQIMKLIQMADSIHKLQEKLEQLQSEVLDISIRKSVGTAKGLTRGNRNYPRETNFCK
jgi:hypothetical protein